MGKTDQNAKQYLCVRVQIVEVKKGLFGFKDNEYSSRTFIPNMRKDAYEIFDKFDKLGKKIIGEHVSVDNKEVGSK